MRGKHVLPVLGACMLLGAPVMAQEADMKPAAAEPPCPGCVVELQTLLGKVAAKSGKKFLVDARVPPTVQVRGTGLEDPDYPVLLLILRANGLAAAEIEGYVHVIPDAPIRQMPLPLVQRDDPGIADEEWVVRVINVPENVSAPMLVPLLRPLLSQAAHLAAQPGMEPGQETNHLIIVARYAKVRQIMQIVELLAK
jgi:hypothetical protein